MAEALESDEMSSPEAITAPGATVEAIRHHYDRLAVYYRAFWGEHIHHGYWENAPSPRDAQLKLIERLAARAGISRGARVLDIGCGFGGSSLWLARNCCSVLGVTISPVQAAIARLEARARGCEDRARFEVMDANRLDLPPESFDVAWVIESSEHLADKQQFIASCARVLKPGGVLALCAWLAAETPATAGETRLIQDICEGMLCPSLATWKEYTGWMASSGFERIEGEDITRQVEETWTRCAAIAARPKVRALLRSSDEATRRFVETFPTMRRAYAAGALAYGMFTARKKSL